MSEQSMVRLQSRLKMRHLVLLRTLGEKPNLRRAAVELNISQPSASALLREIEDAFNAELFVRETPGLTPTPSGIAVIEWSKIILADVRRALTNLNEIAGGGGERIRLGVSPIAVPKLIPTVFAQFRERQPHATLSIQTGIEESIVPKLTSGDLDLAVVRLVPETMRRAFHYEVLFTEDVRVVVGEHHPLAARADVVPKDLDGYDWVLPSIDGAPYDRIGGWLVNMGAGLPKAVAESWSVLVVAQLLQSSECVSVLPESVALQTHGLHALPFKIPGVLYPVVLLSRGIPAHNVALQSLADAIRQASAPFNTIS